MKREVTLWAAVLAGPLIWFTAMQTNFVLAPWACAFGWKPALYVVSIIALAIVAGSGLLAHKHWKQLGEADAHEAGGSLPANRALAIGGMGLSAMFFLVIVAQTIPQFILGSCE
jgi:hypothetical protein